MIYFIENEDSEAIKTGTTVCLTQRFKSLCNEVGQNLRVLAVMPGSYEEEKTLHRRFAEHRIRESVLSEWFRSHPDLVRFIRSEGKPWDGIDESSTDRKPMIVQVRGSLEFKEWAEALARSESLPLAALVSRALIHYARSIGFSTEAPKR